MYATSDFAASPSTHRCAYLHSCCQGVCAPSACGFAAPAAIECGRPAAFRNPPAPRSGAAGVEGFAPPVQSTHQTFFVDGDQCARSPTSSLTSHEWQRPPYFSEMKRRSSGSFVNGSWSERLETRQKRIGWVGKAGQYLRNAAPRFSSPLTHTPPRRLLKRWRSHVELPEERLPATFDENSTLELTPDLVGPSITRNEGIVGGSGVDRLLSYVAPRQRRQ